ncbi:hypothetical protein PNEG_01990 [Pneumocystis murina B123]|uniref:Uncharacterized protein n=1 Tax=Pneumocystis murina (strain B123) TaxID=1069680 RepID=M7PH92_PNEMU|nr:hypothetical protein PNEG_01990 [Pneumocystis murina B123]EMR09809.1 hypothetical protein PNEG_01990 [Pneumocystis murina B123]
MNKPWSIAVGWVSLTIAAGIGYYFAKKDIKARHRDRILESQKIQEKAKLEEIKTRNVDMNSDELSKFHVSKEQGVR